MLQIKSSWDLIAQQELEKFNKKSDMKVEEPTI